MNPDIRLHHKSQWTDLDLLVQVFWPKVHLYQRSDKEKVLSAELWPEKAIIGISKNSKSNDS